MNKLSKPTLDYKDVFTTCISTFSNRNSNNQLKNRLEKCVSLADNANKEYEKMAKSNRLYELPVHDKVNNVIGDDFIKIYSQKMLPKNAVGRKYYNEIKALAPHGKCPICNQRLVTTLDHFLPKKHYPIYSITPINLIPACSDCNRLKLDSIPSFPEDVFLHPYFDDITNARWLKAVVIEGENIRISYEINTNCSLSDVLKSRLIHQFNTVQLSSLYSLQAASEEVAIRSMYKKLYLSGGIQQVKFHLNNQAQSRSLTNKNSWQSALYTALSESEWYCSDWLVNS